MKYITLFDTVADFEAAQATLDLPNVSLIEENMSMSYNPYVPETRLVCKYNVITTKNETTLLTNYENSIFKSMEVDGVMLDEVVGQYIFDTIGIHTVKYELYDEIKLGNQAPVFSLGTSYVNTLIECIIPDSVAYIGQNVFNGCTGLTSIIIPNSVTSIGMAAFSGCTSLTSITIPDSVTGISDRVFNGCSGLTSIVIPDSVEYIGLQTFQKCTSLTSITIGNSVTSIGAWAFNGCSSLTSIVSNAITAPTIQSDVTFQDINTGGTLTVPAGSTGYNTWMSTGNYYLGKYNWTKVEQ